MEKKRPRRSHLALVVAATAAAASFAPANAANEAGRAPAERKNVLLIVADDLNTRLPSFGFPETRTPNIDQLAKRGVAFQQAYAQFPLCAPSRASMLTGMRPNSIRVYDLQTLFRDNRPDAITLPQYFRQNGYFTARVGKIFHQGVPSDIGTSGPDDLPSWDRVVNPKGRDTEDEVSINILGSRIPLGVAFAYRIDDGPDEEQTDGRVATAAIRMIEARKKMPFFIAVGFYRPHVPEVAPKQYFDMYPLDSIAYTPTPQSEIDALLPAANGGMSRMGQRLSGDEQKRFIQSYYAATSFMDAQLGRILAGLRQSGAEKNTIVVFVSDHGFSLGEHGQWQKSTLWDSATRVPLIIYDPAAKGNGRSSRKLVELVDLFPTIAELAGLPLPQGLDGDSFSVLLADPDARGWSKPAQSQTVGGRSVRFENWRYTLWANGTRGSELYDLAKDPGEKRNLASDPGYSAIISKLATMLPGVPPASSAPKIMSSE